jgi:hypothetical protein
MRFLSLLLLARHQAIAQFINPPELPNDHLLSPANNPIYAVGSFLNVTWVAVPISVGITVVQLNSSDLTATIVPPQNIPGASKIHTS